MPDIRPRAIPDLWRGSGAGAGSLTLEEYLALEPWLAAARETVLKELSYPVEARKLRLSGAAEVVITADRNGRVVAWSFLSRTGQTLLDREIERSLGRVRRLPRFPDEIAYEQLSFTLPMRFELVFEGRTLAPSDAPPPPASRPAEGQLAAAQLAACAQTAATLTASQTEIAARRAELEALLADYERQARRYERERRDLPVRVRSMLDRYNDGVAGFEQSLTDFEAQAGAFAAACGKGSADWETFRRACAPYADVGNPYCEAFGELWARLRAGR
ncbi:MAG: TonB family protein [Pseudomonadota bacterium]